MLGEVVYFISFVELKMKIKLKLSHKFSTGGLMVNDHNFLINFVNRDFFFLYIRSCCIFHLFCIVKKEKKKEGNEIKIIAWVWHKRNGVRKKKKQDQSFSDIHNKQTRPSFLRNQFFHSFIEKS